MLYVYYAAAVAKKRAACRVALCWKCVRRVETGQHNKHINDKGYLIAHAIAVGAPTRTQLLRGDSLEERNDAQKLTEGRESVQQDSQKPFKSSRTCRAHLEPFRRASATFFSSPFVLKYHRSSRPGRRLYNRPQWPHQQLLCSPIPKAHAPGSLTRVCCRI
jgi:hypothetical protein